MADEETANSPGDSDLSADMNVIKIIPDPEATPTQKNSFDEKTTVNHSVKSEDSEECNHEYQDNQESNVGCILITKLNAEVLRF
jgi:hypothetical protein